MLLTNLATANSDGEFFHHQDLLGFFEWGSVFDPMEILSHRGLPLPLILYAKFYGPFAEQTDLRVKLPVTRHVYDVVDGKHLGKTSIVAANLPVGKAKLYAIVPYAPKSLTISARLVGTTQDPRLLVAVRLKTGNSRYAMRNTQYVYHVLRIEVTDSQGRKLEAYRTKVELTAPTASVIIPLAINDRLRKWMVKVTDVTTGLTAHTFVFLGNAI